MHKTHAGIDWVGSSLYNTAKIALDRVTMDYLERKGYDPWELRRDWKRVAPGSGVMSKGHFADLEDLMDLMLPDFREHFERASTHDCSMGAALGHRARWTVQNDETKWLRSPAMAPFYRMVRDRVNEGKVITPPMRFQAHEQVVCQVSVGQPGVYVRQSPYCPEMLYMGGSGDVASRNAGHYNGDLYLCRVYRMPNKTYAHQLESSLFDRLEESGLIVHRKNPSGPVGRQGVLTLDKGVNPVLLLDGWVDTLYRHFCRGKLGLPQA